MVGVSPATLTSVNRIWSRGRKISTDAGVLTLCHKVGQTRLDVVAFQLLNSKFLPLAQAVAHEAHGLHRKIKTPTL